MSVLLLTLCVTIATNITNGLLINYTRIGSAFNKLSENIFFYILTLTIMAVVFDLLRAIAEYWFRKKNRISWGTFWFQIEEYERVKGLGKAKLHFWGVFKSFKSIIAGVIQPLGDFFMYFVVWSPDMYHKLTVYVKSRYQTNLFPSCCFGDKYHKYHGNSINILQISFIFLHTVHNDMFQRCTTWI